MKKIVSIVAVLISFCNLSYSQVSFALQYKPIPDSFYVYLRPGFSDPTFNMGVSQATIVFNNTFPIASAAGVTITSVNSAWLPQDFGQEAGGAQRKFLSFLTSGAALGSLGPADLLLLFRFRVTGGNCAGGTSMRLFVNGTDPIDPGNVFADLTAFVNVDGVDHLATNTNPTMLSCLQLILPVNFLEFNARRDNSNGVVNWSVSGEDNKSSYYELERSLDGTNFQSIARIDCRKLPGIQSYEYTDLNISRFNARFVYYRVKQYDVDAKFIVSGVRQLRFDITDKGVQMYPNPVVTGFYVNVPFVNPDQSKVSLIIINSAGQPVQAREITSQQATNYYFDIQNAHLAAGDYYLKIVHNENVLDIKKFLKANE